MYTYYVLDDIGKMMNEIYLSNKNDYYIEPNNFVNIDIDSSRIYKIKENILLIDDNFIGNRFFRLADSTCIDENFGIYMHTLYQDNKLHFLPELKFYGNNLLILPNFLMEIVSEKQCDINNDYFLNGYDEIEFDKIQYYFTKNDKELVEINEKIKFFNQKLYSELEQRSMIKNTEKVIIDLWRH